MKALFFLLILFYAQISIKTHASGEDIINSSSSKNYLFFYNEDVSIRGVTGIEIKVDGESSQERAINFTKKFGEVFGLNLSNDKYKVKTVFSEYDDYFEQYTTRLKVFYKNIPFDKRHLEINENKKGKIIGFDGYIPPVLEKYTKPAINLTRAIANAKKYLNKDHENPVVNMSIGDPIKIINNSKLVLVNSMKYHKKKLISKTMASWRIQYNGHGAIYVNAITGQISSIDSGIRINPPRAKLP